MEIASQNQHCPSLLSSRSLLFLLGAAICTPLCPQAGAQHPATVNVIFHSRLPAYRPPTAVEQEISAHVAKICADKFPHWRYRAGTDADFPQLRVEITQESNDKRLLGLSLVVDRDQPVGPGSRWREPLFAPGDAILRPVMPTDAEAPTFFAEAFEQQLLSNPVILREILAALSDAVPLGGSVVLIPPQRTSENPRCN